MTTTTPPENTLPVRPTGHRILLANVDADGHFNPLIPLALSLLRQGYDVRWYAPRRFHPKLDRLGIPFFPYRRALEVDPDRQDEHFPDRKNRKTQLGRLLYDLENYFIRRAPEFYQDLREINQSYPFDLLIADCAFLALPLVRYGLQKPVFAVGVIPLMQTSRDLAPYGLGLPPARTGLQRAGYALLRQLALRVLFRRPNRLYRQVLREHGVPVPPGGLFDAVIHSATLVLQSGTPGFEYPRRDLARNVRFLGPLLPPPPGPWEPDSSLRGKFALFRKVILLTQGTVEKDPEKLLVPVLEAFKGTDFLVVVTTGGAGTRSLRERFPQTNVVIEDFLPFASILPRTDVFITNGGYGGVLQAIAHRVPLVVAGVHEGKNEINARVGHFGLGINLKTERPTAGQLRESVETVLADPQYRERVTALQAEFGAFRPEALCVHYTAETLALPA